MIGFTGTREGLTPLQMENLRKVLKSLIQHGLTELHHGDCVGADKAVDTLAQELGLKRVIHPPDSITLRAFCQGEVVLPPKPYLQRNQDIVRARRILVACPKELTEQQRSGTWSTVRFARKVGVRTLLLFPDGTVREYRGEIFARNPIHR